jgi:hypothetical protein
MIAHSCLLKTLGIEQDIHQIDREGGGGDRDGKDHGLPPGLKVAECGAVGRKGRVKERAVSISAALRWGEDKIVSAPPGFRTYNSLKKGEIMDTERFLMESPAAKRVRLPARVVVSRGEHSLTEVAAIGRAGNYTPVSNGTCELEVSGVVLARGRIVRKGKRLFFKVAEVASGKEGGRR